MNGRRAAAGWTVRGSRAATAGAAPDTAAPDTAAPHTREGHRTREDHRSPHEAAPDLRLVPVALAVVGCGGDEIVPDYSETRSLPGPCRARRSNIEFSFHHDSAFAYDAASSRSATKPAV